MFNVCMCSMYGSPIPNRIKVTANDRVYGAVQLTEQFNWAGVSVY